MGEKLAKGFAEAGNKLVTEMDSPPTSPGLIEVYPHPALLSLLKLNERAMYKSSKSRSYWPEASLDERIRNLIAMHKKIKDALSERFEGLNGLISIRKVESLSHLKKVEDALDALICAWVGIEYLAGRTVPLGDRTAAIWCPADVVNSQQPA
jgi:predicted RNase H-like nuclease